MSQYRFQVEGAEAPMPEGRQELPGTYKKQKQDISESFYKFEIRNLLDENETKSVISGTSVFKDDIDHDAGNWSVACTEVPTLCGKQAQAILYFL